MTWPIFAVLQMLITTIAVGLALWLRIRAVQKQNEAYQAEFAALESQIASVGPADLLEQLDDSQPTTPLLRLLLAHHDTPKDDIDEQLPNLC